MMTPSVPGHELLRSIGHGACAEVWLARAVATDELRAVRLLRREAFHAAEHAAELFERELAGLRLYEPLSRDNPGLVPILHMGLLENGDFFCVMELADDAATRSKPLSAEAYRPCSLRQLMQQASNTPMPLDEVLAVGENLAHGLELLHEAGLTHGDIKPANIIFIHGLPRLADAGLMAPIGQGVYAGTQGYIPPEGAGSEQADVYALALVLYEMATGLDRFDFPTLPAGLPGGNAHWLAFNRLVCSAADPAPSRRSVCTVAQLRQRLSALRRALSE